MDKSARRSQLLRAARDVFATKGYHDAKVDDIVAAAKVAKGTFYLYFRDKRSVFSELVDMLFERIGMAILHVDPQVGVEPQVKHNIRAIVAVFLDDPALTRILLSYAAGTDAAFVAKIRSFYEGTHHLLRDSLREGQKMGIIAPGDASMYATFTIGALKEILSEAANAKKPRAREEIVTALFELLERGYLRVTDVESKAGAQAEPEEAPKPKRRRKRGSPGGAD